MTEQSRRVHERFPCELDVTVIFEGEEFAGRTINASLGGLFVNIGRPLPFGASAKVRLSLPQLKEEATLPVTVRWVTPEGLGVQFGSLRALEVWALNQFFKKLTPG